MYMYVHTHTSFFRNVHGQACIRATRNRNNLIMTGGKENRRGGKANCEEGEEKMKGEGEGRRKGGKGDDLGKKERRQDE